MTSLFASPLFLLAFSTLYSCHGHPVNRTFIMSPNLSQLGKYSHGVLVDNTLYIAGQVGATIDGTNVPGGITAETRQALVNMRHVLTAAGGTFKDVVKTTVYLQNMGDAAAMNLVYEEFFPKNYPARATFQVAKLYLDSLIEIEAIAVLDLDQNKSSCSQALPFAWYNLLINCVAVLFTALFVFV